MAEAGWKKLSPPGSRLPTPWIVVCLIIKQLIGNGCMAAARATAVAFVLYLRPSELLALTSPCLTPPSQLGRKATRLWTVTLHAQEAGVTSKIGEFDCSMLVDNPDFEFMNTLLAILKKEATARAD